MSSTPTPLTTISPPRGKAPLTGPFSANTLHKELFAAEVGIFIKAWFEQNHFGNPGWQGQELKNAAVEYVLQCHTDKSTSLPEKHAKVATALSDIELLNSSGIMTGLSEKTDAFIADLFRYFQQDHKQQLLANAARGYSETTTPRATAR